MKTGLPLVLEAYDFAQFDVENLSAVPVPVRIALYELLDEVQQSYNDAILYAGVQIWFSIRQYNGDPSHRC